MVRLGDRLGATEVFELTRVNQPVYQVATMCRMLWVPPPASIMRGGEVSPLCPGTNAEALRVHNGPFTHALAVPMEPLEFVLSSGIRESVPAETAWRN
jgi:hypothetical protein